MVRGFQARVALVVERRGGHIANDDRAAQLAPANARPSAKSHETFASRHLKLAAECWAGCI
jgi:hypothetical protein